MLIYKHMILIIFLAALILACYVGKRHGGVAFLAAIAGAYIYELYGDQLTNFICNFIPSLDLWWCAKIVELLIIVGFPLMIYFRAGKGGLFGVLRLVETIAFALLITILAAPTLVEICEFDSSAQNIVQYLDSVRDPILIFGIILSYVDILITKKT